MKKPVFVMGLPRSGTSTIISAMRGFAKMEGYDEGRFLSCIPKILGVCDEILGEASPFDKHSIALPNVNRDLLQNNIVNAIRDTYDAVYTSEVYVDKTLDNQLYNIHWYTKMWPECKIIFMKRRSLEYIESRKRTAGVDNISKYIEEWAGFMSDWFNTRQNMKHGSFLEIDTYDLKYSTDEVVSALQDFLKLDFNFNVDLSLFLQNTQYQKSNTTSVDVYDIDKLDWTQEQKTLHSDMCQPILQKYGYSTDGGYYQ